jgi:hypothetical protein
MLPKISHPTFDATVPSTKKKIRMRPMLVKEEKILLMAKTSKDDTDIFTAIKQVVNNCIITPNIDIDEFTIFDLEFLFIKLRSASVSNLAKVSYVDKEDEKVYEFEVNLDKVEVEFPEDVKNVIKITDDIIITMKYPSAKLFENKDFLNIENQEAYIDFLLFSCVDKIYQGDNALDLKTFSREELNEFIDNLSISSFDNIKNFFNNMPFIKYEIEYKNSLGNERKILLSNLNDFFMLR